MQTILVVEGCGGGVTGVPLTLSHSHELLFLASNRQDC